MVATNRKEEDMIEELKVGIEKTESMRTFLSHQFLDPATLAHSQVPSKRKDIAGIGSGMLSSQHRNEPRTNSGEQKIMRPDVQKYRGSATGHATCRGTIWMAKRSRR